MAIIGKFEITISSGGKVLREYNVPEDHIKDVVEGGKPVKSDKQVKAKGGRRVNHSRAVLKYVEAVPGANFCIKYLMKDRRPLGDADCVAFNTQVDGIDVASPVAADEDFEEKEMFSEVCKGDIIGGGDDMKLHPFCWTNLSLINGKPHGTQSKRDSKYKDLGTIRVMVRREEFIEVSQCFMAPGVADKDVPESAVKGKAVDMAIELQDGDTLDEGVDGWETEPMREPPLATFTFYYRSKGGLQALDIIPRTPEPIALEDRDEETLTPVEMLELIRRQKAKLDAEKVKIKQEKAEANLTRLAGIKREAAAENDDEISIVTQTAKKPRREVAVVELSD